VANLAQFCSAANKSCSVPACAAACLSIELLLSVRLAPCSVL